MATAKVSETELSIFAVSSRSSILPSDQQVTSFEIGFCVTRVF